MNSKANNNSYTFRYPDGMHTQNGETFFVKDNRFHRIGGPARYLTDGRAFHYVNGIDVTVLVEDMYCDGIIEWIDEEMYIYPELDLLTPVSCFTVEMATSHCNNGPTVHAVWFRDSSRTYGTVASR